MRHWERTLLALLAGTALCAAPAGCARLRTWSYDQPDVFLKSLESPPALEAFGDDAFLVTLPPRAAQVPMWIVPRCRVEGGRALITGRLTPEEHTGPFLIRLRRTKKVNPSEIPFFWLDPDGTQTPLEVVRKKSETPQ
ncbi:MAG TPA: hypothetical protein VM492_10090 [Sumerlaeia bacterium]|nr:hypothetical protein [Sumerlaeia bacterium]